ncbi:MAG: HPr family phosphocarrier protein [Succinivibrio sp.]|nr:HPr family phosphocarrier protein [Succinivibrio sp.]
MQQFSYVIQDKDGVHARPAGRIIQSARGIKSEVTIEAKGRKISLKDGIFALMGMGIRCGEEVIVSCSGEDETVALDTIRKSFEENL